MFKIIVYPIFLALFLFAGCQQQNESTGGNLMPDTANTAAEQQPGINKAIAVVHGTKGNNVSGTVTFTKAGNAINVSADIKGLKPGKHGFHIHEYGDCSAEDATSAGGHFNPENVDHGAPSDSVHHVGDLGNIEAGNDGNANFEMTDSLLSFSGSHSIIGRAIIIHGGEDDLKSQPSGNAGPRVACGVIGIAK